MTKKSILALAVLAAGALAPAAHADTFLQSSTTSSSDTITFDGTTLTGSSIPVNLSYLDPITGAPATGTLNFSATAVAGTAGTLFGTFYGESVENISFTITNGSTNILSGTATTGDLSGTDAGLTLLAQEPGDTITYTSSLYGPITDFGLQIGIGPPDTDLYVNGDTLSSFNASSGTDAFTGTLAPTPEPSSIALLATAFATLLLIAKRKLAF